MRARAIGTAVALMAFAFAQDQPAPPSIAQWGIGNWASRLPLQLGSGGVAPGSLIRIRGWRLGPARPGEVAADIRHGERHFPCTVLSASDNEMQAVVAENTPVGGAMLRVERAGQASIEWPIEIVESSFGAIARNGEGWGPGDIVDSGGRPNSETHAARPAETVRLSGTGLGQRSARNLPQVLVAGMPAKDVRVLPKGAARPGVDTLSFELPESTPEGCQVPVVVSSGQRVYSNTVTLAVSRKAGRCADAGKWSAGDTTHAGRWGTVALLHADLALELAPRHMGEFSFDAGFATVAQIDSGVSVNPLFLFPPRGTCTGYAGTAGLHALTSPLTALEVLPGKPLDVSPAITIRQGDAERRLLRRDPPRYWAVIGGHPPVPGSRDLPPFLAAGDFEVSAPGGDVAGGFKTRVPMRAPLVWLNRGAIADVDRQRGVTVNWRSTATGVRTWMLIVAMNADAHSGALGVCACLADAADGSFHIPGYALANIPPSLTHPHGFPMNLLMLIELPDSPDAPREGSGLDRMLGFGLSIAGRTAHYR